MLARKYKIRGRTVRAAINKFGPFLQNPKSRRKLYYPESLTAIRKFNTNLKSVFDDLLSFSRLPAGTQTAIGKNCAVCGDGPVEMHHIRSVKSARLKASTGKSDWGSYVGMYLRKQIPLCKKHHVAIHRGSLTMEEIKLLNPYVKLSHKK